MRPGLSALSVSGGVKLSENVDGRDGRDVVTLPRTENFAKGYLNVAFGTLTLVVAADTATVDIAKAAKPAPARMAMARAGVPRVFTDAFPPRPDPLARANRAPRAAAWMLTSRLYAVKGPITLG